MPAEIHFLRPQWFLALAGLIPLLVLLWRRRGGGSPWSKVVDAHLLPHLLSGAGGGSRRLPIALLALGWLVVVTALAGPVWERLPQPVFALSEKHVFVIDLSPDMDATDVAPSRLARARFELLDLLRATEEGESALVAVGPEPFLVSPLSSDAKTIASQVQHLSTALIPVKGPKRIDLALQMAAGLLDGSGGAPGDVILISDGIGQGKARSAAIDAARELAESGHRVSVLAVGTAQGAPLPRAGGGFAKDADGAIRISRLDSDGLRELAAAGDGRYVRLHASGEDTDALLSTAGRSHLGEEVLQPGLEADQWREEGPWLLLLIIPLAALAFRRGWLLTVLLVVALVPSRDGFAMGWDDLWQRPDQQGAQAFEQGDHARARERFDDAAWRAAAEYRAGDYTAALGDLETLEGPEAAYNRGNALARLGELEEAVAAYQETLEQLPDHADARANLELVQRLLEQQQQQQQDQQGQQGQQGQQSESGESGESGSEQSGESQGSGQEQGGDEQQGSQQGSDRSDQGGQGQEQQDQGEDADAEQDSGGASDRQSGEQGDSSESAAQDQGTDSGEQSGDSQGSASADGSDEQEGQDQSQAPSGQTAGQPGAEPDAGDLAATRDLGGDEDQGDAASAQPAGAEAADAEQEGQSDDASGRAAAVEARQAAEQQESEDRGAGLATASDLDDLSPEERERLQAVESRLNKVPDDPAGLLRQRFILQHLRRTGRLK